MISPTAVRGNASAYDSRNDRFLAVGAYGSLFGRLVRPDGSFASDPFRIDGGTGFAHYPSVAYSPDANGAQGAFLVTWHSNVGTANLVHARLISATGTLLGTEQVIGTEPTWWEAAPLVDYASGTSKVFMVTWRTGGYTIRAARFNNAGQPLDAVGTPGIVVTSTGGERDPSIAYNPETDQFLIAYSDFLNGTHVYARLVSAASGAVSGAQLLGTGTATYITDATYSTSAHKYIVGWYQLPGGSTGRLVNADGTPGTGPFPLSGRYGSYDSMGVAYNPITHTTLMVGQDLLSAENGGAEISDAGVPGTSTGLTFAGGSGNFYPQVSASTAQPKWLLTTAHSFASVVGQFATSTAAGPPPPPPPPPCTITLSATNKTMFFVGGSDTITLTASTTTCPWSVSSNASWLGITSSATGAGSTAVTYQAAFNGSGTGRTGTMTIAGQTFTVVQPGVARAALHDLNGDGISDLVVRNTSTGDVAGIAVAGLAIVPLPAFQTAGGALLTNVPLDWRLAGSGDLNGDGYADLVWQNTNGAVGVWTMRGNIVTDTLPLSIPSVGTSGWQIRAIGDVNGDGRADLIWQNTVDGSLAVWLMNGATVLSTQLMTYNGVPISMPDPNWQIVGAGDLNRDGKADIIWQNQVTGGLGAWTMNGNVVVTPRNLAPDFIDPDYKIRGVGDVNGDGIADLIWVRQSTGELFVWCMNGFSASVFQGRLMLPGSGLPAALSAGWTLVGPG